MNRERAYEIALKNFLEPGALRIAMIPYMPIGMVVNAILEAVDEATSGLKPELPPRPPEGDGLPRYGLRWDGPLAPPSPLPVPMADGYWTPWHLAERYRARAAELEAARVPLTRSQISKASADAQVAFCLDKQPTYEVALAREVERAHGIAPRPTLPAMAKEVL